ncbi:MAG: hypothetical protein Q8P48_04205 [Deltaproteobacteria bacterium]|nr:hypothetical protein [Deltaproteobacteria bacterium]
MAGMARILLLSMVFAAAASVAAPASAAPKAEEQKQANTASGFSISAGAGLGYDSNVYKTPNGPYVDFAQAGNPTVTPTQKTGVFVPLEVDAGYLRALSKKTDLIARYRLDGDFYLGSSLENADEYDHRFSLGPEFKFGKDGPVGGTLYTGVFAGYHKKIYYDRDDGAAKVSGVTDISDRYTYTSMGLEFKYDNKVYVFDYDIYGSIEKRDYRDPAAVSQYDHNYYKLGGALHYKIAGPTRLTVGYAYSLRDYDDRPSRDLNGNATTTNPRLEYVYHKFDVTVRHRINKALVGYADYTRSIRKDELAGYNDYAQNRYKLRAIYTPVESLRLRFAASYWDRDYDRAFAFDNPVAGAKKYDGISLDAKGEYSYTERLKLWAGFGYDDQNTTDKRYDYDRYQAMAGVSVEY